MIEIITTFVFPGGCAEKDIAGQRKFVRVCLGLVNNPEYGLIAEMEGHFDPIPWESKAIRDEATEKVRVGSLLDKEVRDKLVAHMERSKFYGVKPK